MKKSILFFAFALLLCASCSSTESALLNEFVSYCDSNEGLTKYQGDRSDINAVCRWYIEQPSFDDVTDFDGYVQVYNTVYDK